MSDIFLLKRLHTRPVVRLLTRKKKAANSALAEIKLTAPLRYENTYQLEPLDSQRFVCHRVKHLIVTTLSEALANTVYDPVTAPRLSIELANDIKEKLKLFNWKRYKFVVYILIGQNICQSLMSASRCIWSENIDNFVAHTYENASLFAVCSVFGTYFE